MSEPIENEYFNWLCAKVVGRHNTNHLDLLIILHRTEFVWVVPADRNRSDEGIELRDDFIRETCSEREHLWVQEPCSVLELLIAFAKRASFQTEVTLRAWFWTFMTNLKLDEYRRVSEEDLYEIEEILYTFIWRQYDENGVGGMFPMSLTVKDQRKIEIWYQFHEYIDERQIY